MDADAVDPTALADDLMSALDAVLAATAGRMLVAFEEHGIGLEEGRLLVEPRSHVVESRATRRVRSRMRQRGWLDADNELTLEGHRLAAILRRAGRAALAEHIAGLPRAQQLRMAAGVHLLGGDLDQLAPSDGAATTAC